MWELSAFTMKRSPFAKYLILMAAVMAVTVSAQPIYVGTFTYSTYVDKGTNVTNPKSLADFLEPFFVGLKSAALAINTAGGIHGKQIQLVECETAFETQNYFDCMDQWKTLYYPHMVAVVALIHDQIFQDVYPKFVEQNILLIDPLVDGDVGRPPTSPFSDKHVFLQADSRLQLISLVKKAVNGLHFRRIGFLYGIDAAHEKEAEVSAILKALDVTYVGSYAPPPSNFDPNNWQWPNQEYNDFLALKPQAIITFMSPDPHNLKILMDILNRSFYRSDGLDSNVVILGGSAPSAILIGAAYLLLFQYHVPIRINGRIFLTAASPVMTDKRYLISSHAKEDAVAWFGSQNFLFANGSTYSMYLQQTWTQMQFVAEVARRMNPNNLTKDAFIDTVFDSATIPVDDVLFGMFSRNCTGMRKVLDIECECNQGFRIVELFKLNPGFGVDLDASAEAVTPFTDCGSSKVTVPFPLIFLSIEATDAVSAHAATKLTAGVNARSNMIHSVSNSWETLKVSSFFNISDVEANVSSRINERFVSAVMASVAVDRLFVTQSLPFIDPLIFPAAVAPTLFQANVIYMSATLQQEIHVLVQMALTRSWGFSILARGIQSRDIVDAATKSLNTFGASPVAAVDNGILPFTLGHAPSTALLITGIASYSDFEFVVQYLTDNPTAVVMLAFSEFSMIYDQIIAGVSSNTSSSSAMVANRVLFATSMRNWNAPNMTSNLLSPLMRDYFINVPRSNWHPLTLRGFIASAAMQQIIAQLSTAFSPFAILKELYSKSVLAISSEDFIGAYSNSTCYAPSDALCQTNVGARTLNVMSLADVAPSTQSQSYQFSFVFPSGRVSYLPLASSTRLSTWEMAGIVIGSVVGVALLFGSGLWARSGARNNSRAPKDPQVPVTLVFTDIESSTGLWAAVPDIMARALDFHHFIIRDLIKKHKCYEVKTIGDSFMIACRHSQSAVRLAVEIERRLFEHDWGTHEIDNAYREFEREKSLVSGILPRTADLPAEVYSKMWNGIRVRIGIHTGIAEIKFDEITKGFDYYGPVSNIAARVEGSGHGGQIIITKSTLDSLGNYSDGEFTVKMIGAIVLRGVPHPVELHEVNTCTGFFFLAVRDEQERDDTDAEEDVVCTSSASTNEEKYADGDATSSSSEGHVPAQSKNQTIVNWRSISVGFLTILLGTCSEPARTNLLEDVCKRWHLALPRPQNKNAPRSVREDPRIFAVAKRIAPMLKKKFGIPVLKGNFVVTPTTTPRQAE